MIRFIIFIALTASITACTRYREPTVNCFRFLAASSGETDCDFIPLGGPDLTEDDGA